jgi:predicted N-formylglutamate amidohydrolase
MTSEPGQANTRPSRRRAPLAIFFSCEHGGHDLPPQYKQLFGEAGAVLKSHRGWDPGAIELANCFASAWKAPLFSTTISRLLVELNRSPGHAALFSEFTCDLPRAEREALLDAYYWPYRAQVERHVEACLKRRQAVLHIGVHTFTPNLNGEQRNADIGLLYDPRHGQERALAESWRAALKALLPELRVRMNYPYRGTGDGLTTHLRRCYGKRYAGIELEVNQRWPLSEKHQWPRLQGELAKSLEFCRS